MRRGEVVVSSFRPGQEIRITPDRAFKGRRSAERNAHMLIRVAAREPRRHPCQQLYCLCSFVHDQFTQQGPGSGPYYHCRVQTEWKLKLICIS